MMSLDLWGVIHADDQHVLWDSGGDVCSRHGQTSSPTYPYQIQRVQGGIEDSRGEVLEGELPSRQMILVQAWIELHQDDLMADWHLAITGQTPFKIDPLR